MFNSQTLEEMNKKINEHFNQAMKIHKELLSMFEQYQVRPTARFIPEVWKYRIICNNGKYFFGIVKE